MLKHELQPSAAFTLIELCVVLATIVLFALTLLPVLASTRPNTQATRCLNNLRQLAAGWIMYAGDNDDRVMRNPDWVGSSFLDWGASPQNTNTAPLLTNLMGQYVKSVEVWKCPADKFPCLIGPRCRSVSMNGALGSSGPHVNDYQGNRIYYGQGPYGVGRGALKMSELNKPGPTRTILILDEHPDSINDGAYMFDPAYPPSHEHWRDLPASYHNGGAGISFADGHVEMHKWANDQDGTVYPVTKTSYPSGATPWKSKVLQNSRDYEWVEDGMPYREK